MTTMLENEFVELVVLVLALALSYTVGLAAIWVVGLKIIDAIFRKVEE